MFNSKKIKALEKRISDLEELYVDMPKMVKDENTGYLMFKEDAVGIKTEEMHVRYSLWGVHQIYPKKKTTYYKKGTEPKCDLIEIDTEGNKKYIKNNVEVDISGNYVKAKK